jgi:hypothetical protein
MNKDGNDPEGLRLPQSLADSGDPVEGNPFPTEHPAHQVWLEATREAEAEICRLNADALTSRGLENAHERMLTMIVAKFDVWAKRGIKVIWTDDAERHYAAWLVNYANSWVETIGRDFDSRLPAFPLSMFLDDLQQRLRARILHWRTEALRYRVQQEADAAAQARRSADLVNRRWEMIRRYRDGNRLDAVGFARRVGVSDSVIRAIVREDRTRFKSAAQERLLKAIGMTREDWYRE